MVNLSPEFDGFDNLHINSQKLEKWNPPDWPVAEDWKLLVSRFFASETGLKLGQFIRQRIDSGATIYPSQPLWALELTPLRSVKVVILGQDPYHGPGQAQGLAFSVASGLRLPPSLRNIYKEIARDPAAQTGVITAVKSVSSTSAPNAGQYADGSLVRWAQQGVLLLNTCLSVEDGQPACHAKQGWEVLTDEIVKATGAARQPIVFMLWGAHAQAKLALLNSVRPDSAAAPHLVLTANHPSPLSALRPPKPFLGCGHFGLANAFLHSLGVARIHW